MKLKILNWALLIIIAGLALAMVAVPVWLIQPFTPQTDERIRISFFMRQWSPILTIAFALLAIVVGSIIYRGSKRWFSAAPAILPLLVIGFSVWFAQQNHFLWMFNPLENTKFAKVGEADFVADGDAVMSVTINGDTVAFPIRQMAYHHVVQDIVGGMPITATY